MRSLKSLLPESKLERELSLSLNTVLCKPVFLKEDYIHMPEVGDMAPDFELKSHLEKDKKVRLSGFRGQQNVVLAFYPLAWTPV